MAEELEDREKLKIKKKDPLIVMLTRGTEERVFLSTEQNAVRI